MNELRIQTQDGLSLKAWYRRPVQASLLTLVYFHSNAGHIGDRAYAAKAFLDAGYGVLLVTYRGYSDNPEMPSEEGLYKGARGALEFLKQQQMPQEKTVLYGSSIGAAVAIQMAVEYHVGVALLVSFFMVCPVCKKQ